MAILNMDRETISFRLPQEKKEALDKIANALDRDRSYVLNEAIDAYLDVQSWQLDQIREGLRQADAGEFASDTEVAAAFARWRKR
jgi:RHH-type rel operon transcriptional repressor/antitoxin RelB